jgi:hypothetical protein
LHAATPWKGSLLLAEIDSVKKVTFTRILEMSKKPKHEVGEECSREERYREQKRCCDSITVLLWSHRTTDVTHV